MKQYTSCPVNTFEGSPLFHDTTWRFGTISHGLTCLHWLPGVAQCLKWLDRLLPPPSPVQLREQALTKNRKQKVVVVRKKTRLQKCKATHMYTTVKTQLPLLYNKCFIKLCSKCCVLKCQHAYKVHQNHSQYTNWQVKNSFGRKYSYRAG